MQQKLNYDSNLKYIICHPTAAFYGSPYVYRDTTCVCRAKLKVSTWVKSRRFIVFNNTLLRLSIYITLPCPICMIHIRRFLFNFRFFTESSLHIIDYFDDDIDETLVNITPVM